MGLIVNLGGTLEETETQNGTDFSGNPLAIEQVTETTYSTHMGCDGGLDLVYNFNEKIDLSFGIDGRILRPTQKEAEITKREVNGVDQLSMMMVGDYKWEFVDKLDEGSNNPLYNSAGFDSNSAREVLSDHADLNSWNFSIAARYYF